MMLTFSSPALLATFVLLVSVSAKANGDEQNSVQTITEYTVVTSIRAITLTRPCDNVVPTQKPWPSRICGDNNGGCDPEVEPPRNLEPTTGPVYARQSLICGENNIVLSCTDNASPVCTCKGEAGWECVCPSNDPPRLITITKTSTTYLTRTVIVEDDCPITHPPPPATHRPPPTRVTLELPPTRRPEPPRTRTVTRTAPPARPTNTEPDCPANMVPDLLIFDDFYLGEPNIEDTVRAPPSPFDYRGFTFDPTWAFAFCENLETGPDQTCIPTTEDGNYFISLFYQLDKDFASRVSRRITYDRTNDFSIWEVKGYHVSAFPKPGQVITVLLCAWSIEKQKTDIEPSFCHPEFFYEHTIRRHVVIDNEDQQLAFVEFTGYDGYYSPGGNQASSNDKGLAPAEFYLDDLAVCTSYWNVEA